MSIEAFRVELSDWIEANAPPSLWHTTSTPFQGFWGGRNPTFASDAERTWFERCVARGLTAPRWPEQDGGAGFNVQQGNVWTDELAQRGLPLPLVGFGLVMIGPILLVEGTDDQKRTHLPAIARGEIRWCQGYSEPGAGSDLANLSTRAVVDGDELVISGQKVWTSHADESDWIFCLVRTDPDVKKQAGITFVLFDMNTPGIDVRPIELISGSSPFCEVFFDEVRVPVSQVLGEMNRGWGVAKALLRHERGMVGESIAAGGARLPVLFTYSVREHALARLGVDDSGKLADPLIRDQVIRSEMDQEAMRLTVRRANDAAREGGKPGPESSIFKLVGTELNQRRWELAVHLASQGGLGWEGDDYDEMELAATRQWLRCRGNTIEGGTSEVQRNIVARHVLGLPKGK
jgi:acyl-CoA dehydrogenase